MSNPAGCTHTARHEGQTCEQYEATMGAWQAANAGHSAWPESPAGIVYNPPNISALDADLLAWAKWKAVSPWEWTPGGPICAFCRSKQSLAIGGFILNPEHTPTCLAVRANGGAK